MKRSVFASTLFGKSLSKSIKKSYICFQIFKTQIVSVTEQADQNITYSYSLFFKINFRIIFLLSMGVEHVEF